MDDFFEKQFNGLYLLEKQARDLYNNYLKTLKDKKARKVLTKIRDDEIRHMQLAKEILKLEKGIEKVLEEIKNNFEKSCPKCGGNMEKKFIILGPENRIRANQCLLCKFYLPT